MKKKTLDLNFIWGIRLSLRAEGDKLCAEGSNFYAEGNKLRAESSKLCAEGNKLCAEGNKLRAEGNKLCAEGSKLWAEAIIQLYGNIQLKWKNYNLKKNDHECHLETGEVFKP